MFHSGTGKVLGGGEGSESALKYKLANVGFWSKEFCKLLLEGFHNCFFAKEML